MVVFQMHALLHRNMKKSCYLFQMHVLLHRNMKKILLLVNIVTARLFKHLLMLFK